MQVPTDHLNNSNNEIFICHNYEQHELVIHICGAQLDVVDISAVEMSI